MIFRTSRERWDIFVPRRVADIFMVLGVSRFLGEILAVHQDLKDLPQRIVRWHPQPSPNLFWFLIGTPWDFRPSNLKWSHCCSKCPAGKITITNWKQICDAYLIIFVKHKDLSESLVESTTKTTFFFVLFSHVSQPGQVFGSKRMELTTWGHGAIGNWTFWEGWNSKRLRRVAACCFFSRFTATTNGAAVSCTFWTFFFWLLRDLLIFVWLLYGGLKGLKLLNFPRHHFPKKRFLFGRSLVFSTFEGAFRGNGCEGNIWSTQVTWMIHTPNKNEHGYQTWWPGK